MISIIMPVYNAEQFLGRSIDSIMEQNVEDIELILVDDGSKDMSGEICDEYACENSCIRVFHKENGGVSSARNLGLDNAKGEWIMFVDSDDILLPEALKNVQNAIRNGYAELYIFDYQVNGKPVANPFGSFVTKSDFISSILTYKIQTSPWAKVYRKSKISKLRFLPGLKIGEDLLFNFEYIMQFDDGVKIDHISHEIYSYTIGNKSAMNSNDIKDKYLQLNNLALPVMNKYDISSYQQEIACFELNNIFQAYWRSFENPSQKADERMNSLAREFKLKSVLKSYSIIKKYLCLLQYSKHVAHLYLNYRHIRTYIKREYLRM